MTVLFVFFFIPFKVYLLWINYKARFRYGLYENSPIWRRLDGRIGVFSLALDLSLHVSLVFILSMLITLVFGISLEISLALSLFGGIGMTIVNLVVDKASVEGFEKLCLTCKHKDECNSFHEKFCQSLSVKQRLRAAVSYTQSEKTHQ